MSPIESAQQSSVAAGPALNHEGRPRTCGVRFSGRDGAAILACAIVTAAVWPFWRDMAILFPVVLGHFFLFCNVFRIARNLELTWAGVFLVNFACWALFGRINWPAILAIQTPITAVLIAREMRKPTYHGAFARTINAANIDRYLRGEI